MIDIIPFKFKNMDQLREILESQHSSEMFHAEKATLPKIGYIALLNKQPIAVGFLRRLEPCYAQIDTLASNAYFGSQIRHEGIKLVVDSLLEEAKRLKIKGIMALSTDEGVLKRAKDYGFNEIKQTVIGRML